MIIGARKGISAIRAFSFDFRTRYLIIRYIFKNRHTLRQARIAQSIETIASDRTIPSSTRSVTDKRYRYIETDE